jgi:DNA-binding transcriptional ArsR family regulator
MAKKIEMTEPVMDLIAERFKVLGEPMRIRLLNELRDQSMTVGELRMATGASQQNVSKHLGILHQAGMVGRERSGNQMRYSIADPSVFELCELVCGGVRARIDELDRVLRAASA